MTANAPNHYWCVCRRLTKWGRRNPYQLSLLIVLFAVATLSGCAGVTSAKPNSSPTNVNFGTLSISPAAVTFGSVQVGSTSNQSLTATNSGSLPITISQVSTIGPGFA